MTETTQREAYWQVVDSGEVIFVDEDGNMRFPEAPSYKGPPEGVSDQDIGGLPESKLYRSQASHLESASAAAKRLAKEHNISLLKVEGTGANGNITVNDVEALVEGEKEEGSELTPEQQANSERAVFAEEQRKAHLELKEEIPEEEAEEEEPSSASPTPEGVSEEEQSPPEETA